MGSVQVLANGLVLGLTILLVALGFQLILGVMRIVNFAHGEFYMLGAFGVWYLSERVGLNYWLSIPLSMIAVATFGLLTETGLLRKLRGRLLPQMIITFGLLLILQTCMRYAFGVDPKAIPSAVNGVVDFGGVRLSHERVAVCLLSVVTVAGTLALWRWTKTGMAIRAMAQEPDAARLQGVSLVTTNRVTIVAASGLAAAAGGLVGPLFQVEPAMGGPVLLKCLVVIALAGMGSLGGSVIVATALGIMESAVTVAFSSEVAAMVYFAVLVLVLLVRPTGLFGQELEIE